MSYLFFDTETTGLLPKLNTDSKPRLVQLGLIIQDNNEALPIIELNLLIKQPEDSTIPAEAIAVHGITDVQTQTYGMHIDLVDIIFSRLLQTIDTVVAHNLKYDLAIIHYNLPRSWKILQTKKHFCTMQANIDIVKARFISGNSTSGQYKYPSLTESYRYYFNIDNPEGHSAIGDSRACRSIYFAMDIQ